MRLQQRILVIILPLILVPTILLGWFAYSYSKQTKNTMINAQLEHEVSYKVFEINHLMSELLRSTQMLADAAMVTNGLSTGTNDTILSEVIKRYYSAYPNTKFIAIFDNAGKTVKASNFNWQDAIKNNDWFEDNETNWHFIGRNGSNQPSLVVQKKLQNESFVGSLVVGVDIDINNIVELDKQQSSLFLITTMTGEVVYSYPSGEIGRFIPLTLSNTLGSNNSNFTPSIRIGNQKLHVSSQILADKYIVFIGHDRLGVIDNTESITWITASIVLASIIAAIILIYFSINRYVILPMERLSSAKQNVAQGKLDVKLDVNGKDEFSELFASFNVMVRQLIVYREKERDSRLRLEYKVKERTEELEAINSRLENINKELESAKYASEQASAMKTAFVANMSHEIRTPLTAILGFTEQVIADDPRTKTQLDLLGRVLRSGKHLLALINNILDMSKIEANKLEVDVEEVDLFELFNDVISLLSIQAAEKELDFDFNYSFPLPRFVRTDPTRLRQILLNLASNAIKFTEQGFVHIDVRFNEVTWKIEVTVSDSGIGMSQEVANSLFQPFMQADVSISRKFGGTGLGLVISKNLAELLGGNISVHSELGNGSEFVLDFVISADGEAFEPTLIESALDLARDDLIPSAVPEMKGVEEELKPQQAAIISGKVLVAEDVEDNQYLFKLLLDSLGVEYEIVNNGEEAFEKAAQTDFDLILMDMQMPIMGGLEATNLLRLAGVDTPIYALTANVMKEDLEKHKEAGCNGTIAKPIEKESFISVVANVLTNKENMGNSAVEIPPERIAEMKANYVAQLNEQKTLLSFYIETSNLDLLKAELHKIKGSAGSYGFHTLSEFAGQLEAIMISGEADWSEVNKKAFALVKNIENIIHAEADVA